LSDDWAADLRFASTILTEKVIASAKDYLTYEDLREFYPSLLERLDDS
jgi:dynein assembly factor 5